MKSSAICLALFELKYKLMYEPECLITLNYIAMQSDGRVDIHLSLFSDPTSRWTTFMQQAWANSRSTSSLSLPSLSCFNVTESTSPLPYRLLKLHLVCKFKFIILKVLSLTAPITDFIAAGINKVVVSYPGQILRNLETILLIFICLHSNFIYLFHKITKRKYSNKVSTKC